MVCFLYFIGTTIFIYYLSMKKYHKNPRFITKEQRNKLKETMARLGDISGIVENKRTQEVISGNQRSSVIDINECQIEITHESEVPDAQGTLALGFVHWRGNRYNYRLVDWDERTCEEANIIANRGGGEWDFDILANQFEMEDLTDWGFKEWEFGFHAANSEEGKEQGENKDEKQKNKQGDDTKDPTAGNMNTGERDESDFDDKMTMKLVFSLEEYEAVKRVFSMLSGSPERALLTLIDYNGEEEG